MCFGAILDILPERNLRAPASGRANACGSALREQDVGTPGLLGATGLTGAGPVGGVCKFAIIMR